VRVLVAMSGGVDSSVAAALALEAGHEVVGATMKLWGGASDSGCCSVADVDDARRVAQQLGIPHHVFSFTDDFDRHVVAPYVDAHAEGRTPNPCIECNRHLKFDRFLRRAAALGFDAIATGHHARVAALDDGAFALRRGTDTAKDQSYVLHMLGQDELRRVLLPVGELTKDEVRHRAGAAGLRTAAKPDSQDVCFITATGGRAAFLAPRLELHDAEVVTEDGRDVGHVDAVELVTIGQRRGLGLAGGGPAQYAVAVDVPRRRVVVGGAEDLMAASVMVSAPGWVGVAPAIGDVVLVQVSAHGEARPARWTGSSVEWSEPQRRVAPGQAVVLYDASDPDRCLGGGTAAA
jgi:tRNA-specific 2-thiouridylase